MQEMRKYLRMGWLDWVWTGLTTFCFVIAELVIGPAYDGLPKRGRVQWRWEFSDDVPMRRQHRTFLVDHSSPTSRVQSN